MPTTTKLGLELLQNNAANQTLANETFARLNQLLQAGVVDKDLTAPPASPADEALYIVGGSATGAWAGKDKQLAFWLTSKNAWTFVMPRAGFAVRVLDELDSAGLPVMYGYTGSAWVRQTAGATTGSAPVTPFTGNRTLALSDAGAYLRSSDGNTQSVTVPAQSLVAWPDSAEVHIEQGGAGSVSITVGAGVTINKRSDRAATIGGQYGVVTLKRTAENVWTLFGDLEVSA